MVYNIGWINWVNSKVIKELYTVLSRAFFVKQITFSWFFKIFTTQENNTWSHQGYISIYVLVVENSHVAGQIACGQYLPFPLTLGGQEFYTRNRYITSILLSIILWGQIHVSFFIWGYCPLPLPPCPCPPVAMCLVESI